MKRVIAGLLVAVLMCLAVAGYAADDEKRMGELVKGYTREVLKTLTEIYESDPSRFDADWISFYYTSYKLYQAASEYDRADLRIKTKNVLAGVQFDIAKPLEQTNRMLRDIMDEQYDKWVDGEVSDEKFTNLLISMGRVVFEEDGE